MIRKHYVPAVVSFLLIPAAALAGGMVFVAINPEIAAGHPNYARNYWLLEHVRNTCLVATGLAIVCLWLTGCALLVRAKARHYGWLALAMLGPPGLIALTMLADRSPAAGDPYRQFLGRLKVPLRAVYELCLFVAVWAVAYQAMVLKRDLMILHEASRRGVSTAEIIAEQDASSGRWAFSEGLEVCYFVVMLYLLWPIAFNAVGRLIGSAVVRGEA